MTLLIKLLIETRNLFSLRFAAQISPIAKGSENNIMNLKVVCRWRQKD